MLISQLENFVKGYIHDAAVDIVMQTGGIIPPGFSRIKLPVGYKPIAGEVAIVSSRTSMLNKGIFCQFGLIDAGYEGDISAWVFNASGLEYCYIAGERLFSVVNLKLAPTRVNHKVLNYASNRGKSNIGSSGK